MQQKEPREPAAARTCAGLVERGNRHGAAPVCSSSWVAAADRRGGFFGAGSSKIGETAFAAPEAQVCIPQRSSNRPPAGAANVARGRSCGAVHCVQREAAAAAAGLGLFLLQQRPGRSRACNGGGIRF